MRSIRWLVLAGIGTTAAWWCLRSPSDPAVGAKPSAATNGSWPQRLRLVGFDQAAWDHAIMELLESDVSRDRKIDLLLDAYVGGDPASQLALLDVLEPLRPIEAIPRLIGLLGETRDVAKAVRILQVMRAATRVTEAGQEEPLDDHELRRSFELVQDVFRSELANPQNAPERLRVAVKAIPDIFPADEARAAFEALDQSCAAAEQGGREFFLAKGELYGAWLEYLVGDVAHRDFQAIAAWIQIHPEAVEDEGVKARVVEQFWATHLSASEAGQVVDLFDALEPADAPDDSFVRWLEVKSRLIGGMDDFKVLETVSPMKKAALIHFAGLDLRGFAGRPEISRLQREMVEAAAFTRDPEEREFLESAAAAFRLAVPMNKP